MRYEEVNPSKKRKKKKALEKKKNMEDIIR